MKPSCRMPPAASSVKLRPASPATRPDGEAAAGEGQEGLKMMAIPEDAPRSSPTRLKEPANEPLFSNP